MSGILRLSKKVKNLGNVDFNTPRHYPYIHGTLCMKLLKIKLRSFDAALLLHWNFNCSNSMELKFCNFI